jgi:hypothetical protein
MTTQAQFIAAADSANGQAILNAGAAAPNAAVSRALMAVPAQLDVLRTTPQAFARCVVGYRAARHAIRADTDVSAVKMQQNLRDARQQAQDALDALMTQATTTADKISQTLSGIVSPPQSTAEATLSELQIANAWGIAERVLRAGPTTGAVNGLLDSGIPGMGQAIRRYAPLFIRSSLAGRDSPQNIENEIEATLAQVDARGNPAESAVQAAARDTLAQLTTGMSRVRSSYQMAADEIQYNNAHAMLFGWDTSGSGASVPVGADTSSSPDMAFAQFSSADAVRKAYPWLFQGAKA